MPERQQPFIHQNNQPVIDRPHPGALTAHALGRLVNALGELRDSAGRGDPRLADARREPFDQAIAALTMLREPGLNSAVVAYASLPPQDAAILGDVGAALIDAGTRRPKLLLLLRAELEKPL